MALCRHNNYRYICGHKAVQKELHMTLIFHRLIVPLIVNITLLCRHNDMILIYMGPYMGGGWNEVENY